MGSEMCIRDSLLIGNNKTGINVKDGKVEHFIDYSDIISARVKISFD